ncbi:ribosome hibernation-promoting factor, HPF/YfiA family [Jonesia denitrificans]|jgi:ribosomal subunit interface protein|uniref:Ribosome hibernation promoting factor n=1 Tax=Jonesia denitrificans (strain ATCC 14870 / DSM 20603 / BCRC 15368 / CIP 55.134 / JCM 11481 / NBRC 15587 / NCTC 10816 / Prevot 55134) TaxID=471856 RepID=C7QZG8_JONDD|nr:ribosome-associated translation inhibitor RaiA [Jonesia denitrificans]ACV09466.1 sigma 54 modulation protein/ribosomal protein S30EA [Jonesia denitrificans DSM 20603]AVJ53318.1 ribosome-associated translation inhibitor RaiA [Jonesia denitrificans]QXB43836.1 ribosome-associated translation inhibitor RaiA [Jonesia denitrificans]SQH21825.1 SigL modulation protein [Jonesia denitrificans]
MEIVVVGRHTEVADRFREHAEEKLSKIAQYAPTARRVDVEVTHEYNPRQSARSERVELTVRDKGPVIRAEAASDDRFGALDLALDKLQERLRRAHERKYTSKRRIPRKLEVPKDLDAIEMIPDPEPPTQEEATPSVPHPTQPGETVEVQLGDSPVIIRQKLHNASPMTVDDAIDEMELVGHDFFLFVDKDSKRPSVAYRRRGWTYGVIALNTECDCEEE